MWLAPSLRVKWGPYFKLEPSEQKATVEFAQAALGKGPGLVGAAPLITRRQAVEVIAPIMGIENVDAAMEALEAEATADAAANVEKLKAQQAAMAVTAKSALAAGPAESEPGAKPDPKSEPPNAAPPKK